MKKSVAFLVRGSGLAQTRQAKCTASYKHHTKRVYHHLSLPIDMGNGLSLIVDTLHPVAEDQRLQTFKKLLIENANASAELLAKIMELTFICSF